MGMAVGPSGGQSANINVTPLIDVLLVLLIIFMVISPVTPKGLDALVPQPPPPNAPKNKRPTAPSSCNWWIVARVSPRASRSIPRTRPGITCKGV